MSDLNLLFKSLEDIQAKIKLNIVRTLSSPQSLTKVLHDCGYIDNGIVDVNKVEIMDGNDIGVVKCAVDFLYNCEVEGVEDDGQVFITNTNGKWSCEY